MSGEKGLRGPTFEPREVLGLIQDRHIPLRGIRTTPDPQGLLNH